MGLKGTIYGMGEDAPKNKKNLGRKVLDSAKSLGNMAYEKINGSLFKKENQGYVVHGDIVVNLEDEPRWKKVSKKGGFYMLGLATIIYFECGLAGFGWNPIKYDGMANKLEKQENIKSSVISYVNKGNKDLSFKENYKVKELMGIEDSSKTYEPIPEDWERAYNKIKQEE